MEAGRQLTTSLPWTDTPHQGPAVRVERLVVHRGDSRVLDQLDLTVSRGEVVAVQGSSGSGKTTLLATLCGLHPASAGSVEVLGRDLNTCRDQQRSAIRLRHVGVVFQGDELLPELTLGENITLPLRLRHGRITETTLVRAGELAEHLGILPLLGRAPAEVSGGQLQRAAIARALIHRPAIVLADEPTASLDQDAAANALSGLIALARHHHAAVVVVTHSDAVAALCDRRVVLDDGKLSPL